MHCSNELKAHSNVLVYAQFAHHGIGGCGREHAAIRPAPAANAPSRRPTRQIDFGAQDGKREMMAMVGRSKNLVTEWCGKTAA